MALVSLGLAACASGFKATYDADPAHDFSGYQTFAWISENPMIIGATNRVPNPLLEPRIMAAIEDGMTVRGYRKVNDPESADFTVSFTVGSREEIKVTSYPASYHGYYGYPRGSYWGGSYYGYGMPTETDVRQYQKQEDGRDNQCSGSRGNGGLSASVRSVYWLRHGRAASR
jgi:hypothetical protein